jgi:hypothetical protein
LPQLLLRKPWLQWTLWPRLWPQAGHGLSPLASTFTLLALYCGVGEGPVSGKALEA